MFQKKNNKDDVVDPVDRMLEKTGCIELHYAVKECFFEHQDWRKCQEEVKKFKNCMTAYEAKRKKELLLANEVL